LQATNDAVGVQNVTVTAFPSRSKQAAWLDSQQPDAYVAIGPSSGTAHAVPTLIPVANNRPDTVTLAIGDGTNSPQLTTVQAADYSMTAWNINLGAEALAGSLLSKSGALPALHTTGQVRAAYDAAVAQGAVLDDSRFVSGATPGTFTVDAHVGASHLLGLALDTVSEAQPATWRDDLAATSGIYAQQSGVTLADYNQIFETAAPGGFRARLALGAYELFFRTRPTERLAATTGAVAATVATVAMASGKISPLDAATLAELATSPRQYQIIKTTWIKRTQQIKGTTPSDPESQLASNRRTFKSDLVRSLTYWPTGASIGYSLLTHPTFGSGATGTVLGLADAGLVGAVLIVGPLYASKVFSSRLGADGLYRASLRWEPGKVMGRALDYAAYPFFTSGSVLNMVYMGRTGQLHFLDFPTASAAARAVSNGGQTVGVISERLANNIYKGRFDYWPWVSKAALSFRNSDKWYPRYDRAVTILGSVAVIASGVASIIVAFQDEHKKP